MIDLDLIDIQYYLLIILTLISLLITVSNLRFLDSIIDPNDNLNEVNQKTFVSVLVPARNEEKNIEKCLETLISQDYENLEILVLDDRSTDDTTTIVLDITKRDPRVRMISGGDLPKGWVGKNWACHQLSQEATGDILIFVDADTLIDSQVISSAIMNSINDDVDLLAIMPNRIAGCVAERLMFPFIDWASFCWMPMRKAHSSKNSHLSAVFGQFILFKRDAYQAIGGHSGIRGIPLDDFEFGRIAKRIGLRWKLFNGAQHVHVMPYAGNVDALRGVSRSIFPALYYRISILTILSTILLMLGFLPIMTIATNAIASPRSNSVLFMAVLSVVLVALPWFIVCKKFNHNKVTVLFYPLSIGLMVAVALHSMLSYGLGLPNWKNRRVAGRKINF